MKILDFRTGFIDLLLNALASIIVLFILSRLLISVTKKENEGIRKDAEYVIIIDWDSNVDCDVDLWVRDPNGFTVFFNVRDQDVMHLERDDLGLRNDMTIIDGKVTYIKKNEEVWTLRGIVPGKYIANVHLYACRMEGKSLPVGTAIDVPVTFKLIKLNPYYLEIYNNVVLLSKIYEEKTALNFTLEDNHNSPTDLNQDYTKLIMLENSGNP